MAGQYLPYVVVLFVSATTLSALAVFAWRSRPARGAAMFSLFMLAVTWLALAHALELVSVGLPVIDLFAGALYPGLLSASVIWLAFALQYSGFGRWLVPRNVIPVSVVPFVSMLLVWIYGPPDWIGGLAAFGSSAMPHWLSVWFIFQIVYSLLMTSAGSLLLLQTFMRSPGRHWQQILLLLFGSFVPWAAFLLEILGVRPLPGVGLVPLGLILTGLVAALALLRPRLLGHVMVARNLVLENVDAAVLVLDAENRIVDVNPAMQALLSRTAQELIGQDFEAALSGQTELVQRCRKVTEAPDEFLMPGDPPRHYDLRVSLLHRNGRPVGRLIAMSDITDRRHAEKELEASKASLEYLLTTSPAVLYVCQPWEEYVTTFISENVERVLGYERQEFINKPWFMADRTHPEDAPRIFVELDRLREREYHTREYRFRHRDGTYRWLRDEIRLMYDAEGEPSEIIGCWIDITEQREAREALRESEERYRSLFDGIPVALYQSTSEGQLLDVNLSGVRMSGYESRQALLAVNVTDLYVNAQDRSRLLTTLGREGIVRGFETQLCQHDGTPIWVRNNVHAVRDADGQVLYYEGSLEDITERKRAEEALQRERDFISAVLDTAGALVVVLDREGRIVRFNRACEEMTGYSFEQVQGEQLWDLFLVPEEIEPVKAVFEALSGGQFPSEHENYWLARDGSRRLIAWSNTALLGQEGAVEYVIGTGIDIEAERKRQQETSVLAEMAKVVSGTLDLEEVMRLTAEYAVDILKADHCIIGLSGESDRNLWLAEAKGLSPEVVAVLRGADAIGDRTREALLQVHRPVVVKDLSADPDVDLQDVELVNAESVLAIPIEAREQKLGVMLLSTQRGRRRRFTSEEVDLALAIANQAAMAIENARLYEAEQRRADQFRVINEVGSQIATILDIDSLLRGIACLIKEKLGYYLVGIGLIEGDELVFRAGAGAVWEADHFQPPRIHVGQEGITGWVAQSGEPLLVPDVSKEPRYYGLPQAQEMRSELAVPLKAKDTVIGVLHVQSDRLDAFDEGDQAVLASLAHQAASAIENARLYEQAQQAATLEERQRLARDLHDSVTQSLYSVTLLAETSRQATRAGDVEIATDCLSQLGEVARQALKEMRLLVYELRPPVLEQVGLVGALQQRLDAVEGRAGIETRLLVEHELELAAPVEEALYRIAMEAMNNSLKHAAATWVTVQIRAVGERVELEVKDNGRGFEVKAAGDTGGMGLTTMRERTENLGGMLTIDSAIGKGTNVRVIVGTGMGESDHSD